jgi:hypothetical protein
MIGIGSGLVWESRLKVRGVVRGRRTTTGRGTGYKYKQGHEDWRLLGSAGFSKEYGPRRDW